MASVNTRLNIEKLDGNSESMEYMVKVLDLRWNYRELKKIVKLRFESLCGGFPSRWESVEFCPIDASIQGWQGLPSGSNDFSN
ncbi:hypothetical protein Tco_1217583 [Tanacetum coccineum]